MFNLVLTFLKCFLFSQGILIYLDPPLILSGKKLVNFSWSCILKFIINFYYAQWQVEKLMKLSLFPGRHKGISTAERVRWGMVIWNYPSYEMHRGRSKFCFKRAFMNFLLIFCNWGGGVTDDGNHLSTNIIVKAW